MARKNIGKEETAWRDWYSTRTPEEKKAYNREHYHNHKDKNLHHCHEWRKRNPDYVKLYGIMAGIKKSRPGAITENSPDIQEFLGWFKERKGQPCKYCGSPAESADHIHPLSKGGEHSLDNLQVICWICNRAKNGMLEEEFTAWLDRIKNF